MRNLVQVREKITSLLTEAEAIQALAASENRELAADELARYDAIVGADDKPGELKALRDEEQRAIKLEQVRAEIAARATPNTPSDAVGRPQDRTRVEVPTSCHVPANIALGRGILNRREQEEAAYGFGRFFMASMGDEKSRRWCKEHGVDIQNAGQVEGWDSKGGFLVPNQYESMLIRLVNDYGVARQEMTVWPMSSDTAFAPRRTSGLTAYYSAEGGTLTTSDIAGDLIGLTAKKLYVRGRYSSEVNEDSVVAMGALLSEEAALAIAYAEDAAAFLGDGTSTYGRIVGLKSAITTGSQVTAASAVKFSDLTLADFEKMVATAQSYAFKNGGPKWFIHRSAWAVSMQNLQATAGGVLPANIANGVNQQFFLGYPVVWVEAMTNTLTTLTGQVGGCYFGNLRQGAYFGSRRGIAMSVSDAVHFDTDEIAVKWTERYDINVHDVGVTGGASGGIIALKFA